MSKFTIQFILIQPEHESKGVKYKSGDIVGFHPLITDAPTTTGRLAFVHVIDAPPISKIKDFMKEVARPVYNLATNGTLSLRSAWKLNLTASNITTITPTRQATIPWSVIKTRLARKSDGKTLIDLYNELNP